MKDSIGNRMRCGILLALAGLAAGCGSKAGGNEPAAAGAIRVRTATLVDRPFREQVRVQGMIEARERARIAARVPGILDELFVDEGTRVGKGAPLFQTDKANLERRVTMEEQNVRVADASVTEVRAALAAAEAVNEKAAADLGRFTQLYEKEKVVSRDVWEKAGLQARQAAAGLAHARAALELALARLDQARAALEIARKQLGDSRVTAPFEGVVSERTLEPGEYAALGAAVLTLRGVADYEARAHVAAGHFHRVVEGETKIVLSARGENLGECVVTQRSPTLDPVSRTFEVRAAVTNAAGLADGMACDIALVLAARTGPGIPSAAIGFRNGRAVVFTVENGVARAVPVTRGIVEGGYTELSGAEGLGGKAIVVEGQTFLAEGTPVRTE